jgi:hypothetical protein
VSEDAITTVSNTIILQIPGISNNSSVDIYAAATTPLLMTSSGIPLTGSMSAGFTIGFMNRMITAEYPNLADVSIRK